MKFNKLAGCLISAMLALAAIAGPAPAIALDEITWLEKYGEALREAKRTGKPIFLEFRCEA